jgi:hypothetical protein
MFNTHPFEAVNVEAGALRGFTASAGLVKLAAEALNCRWYQTMHYTQPHNKTNTCIRLFGMFNKNFFEAVNVEVDVSRGFTASAGLEKLVAAGIRP